MKYSMVNNCIIDVMSIQDALFPVIARKRGLSLRVPHFWLNTALERTVEGNVASEAPNPCERIIKALVFSYLVALR
jgi:hypothetical protein